MTSSMLTGERRWASARRGGMTVLGKVPVPKPINLPSQRFENHGLDPNVEIVPKGTHSWGTRSSSFTPNAWGSPTLSPNADGGSGSPSHLSGRPSSSGSGTRPSTASSDRTHEPIANAWGSNSRPSSASGALTSNQTTLKLLRPHNAETRPGSSRLSQFPELLTDNSVAWGATGTTEKLGWSSMDCIDSAKFSAEELGVFNNAALISEIDRKIKEHTDILLHSVNCLSARVSQLESRMHQIENMVDNVKESVDFNQGKTDGKLREIENILVEVQGGVRDLRDKQDIAEAQLQLAKLQMSKINQPVEKQNATIEAVLNQEAPSSVSQQSHQLLPIPGASPQLLAPSSNVTNLPPQIHPPATLVATAPQLPTHLLQNQTAIPSVPQQERYNPLLVPIPESTYQQYQVPPAQWSQLISYNQQPYQPMLNFPRNSVLPQLPQGYPGSTMVNPQVPSHHSEEVPYAPPHSISQPPDSSPSLQQYNVGSTQQIYPQPSNRHYVESNSASLLPQGLPLHGQTNIMDSYHYGASPCNNGISSIKPSQPLPPPPVLGGQSSYAQLPTVRILPHAIPTASNVDAGSGSGSGGSGNWPPVDDAIDKVAAMGFQRDLVRATVKKLMENGQSVDLNAVLDKLMNNG